MVKRSLYKKIGNFYYLLLLYSIISCNTKNIYRKKYIVKNGWKAYDSCVYNFTIDKNKNLPLDLYFLLEYTDKYYYNNIYFFTKLIYTKKNYMNVDTLEYKLCNELGKSYGNGFINKKIKLFYKKNIFLDKGIYKLVIYNGMRDTILRGINNITFCVDKKLKK